MQLAVSIESLAKTVDDLTHCLPQVPGAGPVKQRAPERRVAAEAGTLGTKRFRPEGEMEVHPAAREPDQPSLLAQGVTANTTVRGRVFRLTEATLKPRRLMYRCSYAGCNREFKNPAGRGKHEKSHRGGEKKPATLTAMRAIRASLSAAQLKATVEIDIKHAILGCISDAASTAKVKGGWAAKVDGCKKNKGSTVRHFRSWAFKKKVIVAYENLEELSSFAFSLADAQRDIKTGEMPAAPAPQVAVPAQDNSEDDKADPEELSENEGSDSDGGGATDAELEGPDFEAPEGGEIHMSSPDDIKKAVIGQRIYHRYDDAWYPGVVKRQIQMSSVASHNGKFAITFDDSAREHEHKLLAEDYGPEGHWVLVKTA